MLINMKKAVLTAAMVTLAPVAPLMIGSAADADAHTYVSGSVTFGSPVAVVGFSYGNPYLYGPVYTEPAYCNTGPVYYYPAYRVYAPYYPAFRYYRYARPTYYYPRYYPHGHYTSYGHHGYIRGHAYSRPGGHSGRGYGVRGHGWDR